MAVTADTVLARIRAGIRETPGPYRTVSFPGMGTQNKLVFRAATPARANAFSEAALHWLAAFEAAYSAFIAENVLDRLNRDAAQGWVTLDAQTAQLLALCDWLHWHTRGVFDPTMGPLIRLWDYQAPHPSPPSPDAVAAARARVGWQRVERNGDRLRFTAPGMQLDLGGMGKEYAVDRIVALAEQHGIADLLVDLGHDVRVRGQPPEGGHWRLGLDHPSQAGRCWAGVGLRDEAICCSGTYLRFFEHGTRAYGHILDPRTGQPADNGCRAAWVIAPTTTVAGALSTAAIVLGADAGLRLIEETYGAAGCIWVHDEIHQTRSFHDYTRRVQ